MANIEDELQSAFADITTENLKLRTGHASLQGDI